MKNKWLFWQDLLKTQYSNPGGRTHNFLEQRCLSEMLNGTLKRYQPWHVAQIKFKPYELLSKKHKWKKEKKHFNPFNEAKDTVTAWIIFLWCRGALKGTTLYANVKILSLAPYKGYQILEILPLGGKTTVTMFLYISLDCLVIVWTLNTSVSQLNQLVSN